MLFKKMNVTGVVGTKSPKYNFVNVIIENDLTIELPLEEYGFLEEGMNVTVDINVRYSAKNERAKGHSVSNHMNDPSHVQAPEFYDEVEKV